MASKIIGSVVNKNEADQQYTLQLIAQWEAAKKQADAFKVQESNLRDEVVHECYGLTHDLRGTIKYELLNGYRLSSSFTTTYKIDDAQLKALMPTLAENNIDVNQLVEWKPSFKEAYYKTLSDEQKLIVDQFITATPGKPQVKIELPKRK